MKRRDLLRLLPIGAATFALATPARGQSLWSMMNRNRSLSDTEREANSAIALQAIETVEPILSYDTANNLQLAIAQYEPFVAAGGWEQVPQETYGVSMGASRDGVIQLKRRLLSSAGGNVARAARKAQVERRHLYTLLHKHGLIAEGALGPAAGD